MPDKTISAEEFDRRFDAGEDISDFVDWSTTRRPLEELLQTRRVNVDFPAWVVAAIDAEAKRLGISRQAVIKIWCAEQLDKKRAAG